MHHVVNAGIFRFLVAPLQVLDLGVPVIPLFNCPLKLLLQALQLCVVHTLPPYKTNRLLDQGRRPKQ